MKNKKKAIVLVYVLFLVTISVIFATILLNNNSYLFNITDLFEVDSKLISNIDSDAGISIALNREMNSNGSGFVDNLSCPSGNTVDMSGTTLKQQIKVDTLTYDGTDFYCLGTYQSKPVKLFFNSGFTDYEEAMYDTFTVTVTAGVGDTTFADSDNTLIDFSSSAYENPDSIDDNFNSDNYKVTSAGDTTTGTYYPDDYADDDVLARKTLYGFVSVDFGFKKVFWNTNKTIKMIEDNTNNNDSLNIKLGDVNAGYLYFDVDKDFDIRLVKFDKNTYNETNELIVAESLTGSLTASIGYLQNNAGTLDLSETKTGSEYEFDFVNNDYAVFLKSTGTGTLLYSITGETTTGTGIYLNPIDDSDPLEVKYLGNDILIDSNGRFVSKEVELFFKK